MVSVMNDLNNVQSGEVKQNLVITDMSAGMFALADLAWQKGRAWKWVMMEVAEKPPLRIQGVRGIDCLYSRIEKANSLLKYFVNKLNSSEPSIIKPGCLYWNTEAQKSAVWLRDMLPLDKAMDSQGHFTQWGSDVMWIAEQMIRGDA